MATVTLNPGEEAQLQQTIEMFEVIVQSQPTDTQSLEILKEAYSKLGREEDVINTSKRIAEAYMQMGQLSSAILEYETVLQRRPKTMDVQAALQKSRTRRAMRRRSPTAEPAALAQQSDTVKMRRKKARTADDGGDGRRAQDACAKFLWRAKSSARAILICAGAMWI